MAKRLVVSAVALVTLLVVVSLAYSQARQPWAIYDFDRKGETPGPAPKRDISGIWVPAAGAGVGLGAGIAMGQAMSQIIGQPPPPPAAGAAPGVAAPGPAPSAPGPGTVCARCETPLDRPGKFCPECGAPLA